MSELSGRSCPQVLGIDEHFFSRKKGYATTLVDLKNHKVFDVVLGRSEASLRSYSAGEPGSDQFDAPPCLAFNAATTDTPGAVFTPVSGAEGLVSG